ncbi:hypothetical protein J1614_002649 [Plenodomus biglobosus]|nr:hypothetical protein J1614_002649 [Plenodomus biglobosus]
MWSSDMDGDDSGGSKQFGRAAIHASMITPSYAEQRPVVWPHNMAGRTGQHQLGRPDPTRYAMAT